MTDTQIQAFLPATATMIVIALGFLYNNSRLSDLNTLINKRIDDMNNRINDLRTEMNTQYSRLEKTLIGKLDEIEERLDR